jgi:hypothetical protein
MSHHDPRAVKVNFTNDKIVVALDDGRDISVPLTSYPRLRDASGPEREDFELLGDGEYIHWPRIDEDLSVAGLLRGTPSFERGVRRR